MSLKKITLVISLLSLTAFSLFAFPTTSLLRMPNDENGIEDYDPFDGGIDESDIEKARANSSGYTASGRGGIVSAVGFFGYGDTVDISSPSGEFVGRYIVFDTAAYKEGERDTLYKLLKPIYKPFDAPRYIPRGYTVKKNFLTTITPLYSAIFSKTTGAIHEVALSISFPKIFHPIALTAGPIYYYEPYTNDHILGGFIGVSYDLPLDYMFMIITNLHFTVGFKVILATSLTGLATLNYGYSIDAGVKFYPLRFMALRVSFVLSSLYESTLNSCIFRNMGIQTGVSFEF